MWESAVRSSYFLQRILKHLAARRGQVHIRKDKLEGRPWNKKCSRLSSWFNLRNISIPIRIELSAARLASAHSLHHLDPVASIHLQK